MNASDLRPRVLAGAIIALGFAATAALHWPGELSPDSVLQLLEGRTGRYNTWHPPIMAWLLGLGDAASPGAGLFVVMDSILGFGAIGALLLLKPTRPGWLSCGVALILCALPQLILYQGIVWKDVFFADAALGGFVCLAFAASYWRIPALRLSAIAISVCLLAVAALARQNGAIVLPFAAAALAIVVWRETRTTKQAFLWAASWVAASGILIATATAALDSRSIDDSGAGEQIAILQIYDLAGAAALEPGLPLDVLRSQAPDLSDLIKTAAVRLYTPERNDPIAASPAIADALQRTDPTVVEAQWHALITKHPLLYLRVRAEAFRWVLLTPDIVACRPLFAGIEGPSTALRALGMAPRKDARDYAMTAYAGAFMGTPVFSHAFWAAVALAGLILLLRRRRSTDIVLAAFLMSIFVFVASFFVISLACDYRYLYALDLGAMAVLFYLSLDLESAIRGKDDNRVGVDRGLLRSAMELGGTPGEHLLPPAPRL